jgi:5-methylthioadenosine/S-adenosylhomocysteine deaminase
MARQGSTLLRGGKVVPMTRRGESFTGDVLMVGGLIADVATHISAPPESDVVEAADCLVMPGFVQAHVHVVQSLARSRAEGVPLLRWLRERIWPYEAALEAEETAAAARLGVAELLRGGTTGALDMGSTRHHDAVFAAAEELGIRFVSGKCLMDCGESVPGALIEECDEALADAERLGARWQGAAGGRLGYAVSPRFILSCSRELLDGAVELARRHGYYLHTHASENLEETRLVRELHGCGNVAALADVGIAGPDTVLAHCVHLDGADIAALTRGGTGVAHCPGANLKLASGIADLPGLLRAGVPVGLGADGPPCNNRLSMFHEMALAGTIHNLAGGASAIDPWEVLAMATRGGAELLGMSDVGRLEAGLRADIVVLAPPLAGEPPGDPAAAVVYGGGVDWVRHVFVDGRPVVVDGHLSTADEYAVRHEARKAASALGARLGWS